MHPGGCRGFQGFGCSPIKALRELGSERRETVRSLCAAIKDNVMNWILSTRGVGYGDR